MSQSADIESDHLLEAVGTKCATTATAVNQLAAQAAAYIEKLEEKKERAARKQAVELRARERAETRAAGGGEVVVTAEDVEAARDALASMSDEQIDKIRNDASSLADWHDDKAGAVTDTDMANSHTAQAAHLREVAVAGRDDPIIADHLALAAARAKVNATWAEKFEKRTGIDLTDLTVTDAAKPEATAEAQVTAAEAQAKDAEAAPPDEEASDDAGGSVSKQVKAQRAAVEVEALAQSEDLIAARAAVPSLTDEQIDKIRNDASSLADWHEGKAATATKAKEGAKHTAHAARLRTVAVAGREDPQLAEHLALAAAKARQNAGWSEKFEKNTGIRLNPLTASTAQAPAQAQAQQQAPTQAQAQSAATPTPAGQTVAQGIADTQAMPARPVQVAGMRTGIER